MKIKFVTVIVLFINILCSSSTYSYPPDYTLMDKPEEIKMTIGGQDYTFKCSYAKEKSRERFVKATLLHLIFDHLFKKWKIEIPKDKEDAVIKYWYQLLLGQQCKKIMIQAAESFIKVYKYVPHGIEFVNDKGMTPQEVYDSYISKKLPKLSANQWFKYYNIYNRPETIKWMNDFVKATPEKQQLLIFSGSALQSVKICIMLHKIYNEFILTIKPPQTETLWQKYLTKTINVDIKSLNIQISPQYKKLLSEVLPKNASVQ